MTYLFDTNILSAQRRPDRLPRDVAAWLREIPADEVFVSAISIQEIEIGVLLKERSDPAQGAMLRRWKTEVVAKAVYGRILSIDEAVAEFCASLHVPDPRPELDSLIAATAIVHRKTLVTRNVSDFRGMPVSRINPWDLPAR
jgi:toxin FitB